MSGLLREISADCVLDRLWLWAHQEGSHNTVYKVPGRSRITPAEAALDLGIANLMMVCFEGRPEPPFDQYAQSLRCFPRVIWSVVGDASSTRNDEESDLEAVVDLSRKFANITGGVLDDFFHPEPGDGELARYSLNELGNFRDALHAAPRPLDLWVVLYDYMLHFPVEKHLAACDGVIFWTWTADELKNLEENFMRAEEKIGDRRKMLGCYLWDYGRDCPMPLELMQRQCEVGLRLLQEKRIEGMVFLASCICDLDIEAVNWTREWIERVGELELRSDSF